MKEVWIKVEHYNRKLIFPALIVLLGIIIIEIFGHVVDPTFQLFIEITDYIVITIFVIDLIFLAIRSKNARFFFRHYWLDLLAVFPFSLVFKIVEQTYLSAAAAERVFLGQGIVHESLEAERIVAKERKLVRLLRAFPRGLRVIIKSRLFTKFSKRVQTKKHSKDNSEN